MFLFLTHRQNVSGAIVIQLEDTSSGLMMTMSGTLNTMGLSLGLPDSTFAVPNVIDDRTLTGSYFIQAGGNTTVYATLTTPAVPLQSLIISSTSSSFNSGDYFAYVEVGDTAIFGFEAIAGFVPGETISIRPNAIFSPEDTIASIFGTNLSSTDQVLSNFANGETLSIRAVPEPSTGFLLATVAIAGIIRRRRTCRKDGRVQI
jgi:hypothetical protein